MDRFRYSFRLICAVAAFCLTFNLAFAAEHQGLWVGGATLKHVSEVNPRLPDMSFDLMLEGIQNPDTLISIADENWRIYRAEERGPADGWKRKGFDDSSWEAAVLSEVSGAATAYFRRSFQIDAPTYSELKFQVWREHGIVIYLNGGEIYRDNLAPGDIGPDAAALSDVGDNTRLEFLIPADKLVEGQNTIAVEVHAFDEVDDNVYFDLELLAELNENRVDIIPMEADEWKYSDAYINGWQNDDFNDEGWVSGPARFVYGETVGEAFDGTELNFGASGAPPAIVYFRKMFPIETVKEEEEDNLAYLRLFLLADDGAVVYFNGTEVVRNNLVKQDEGESSTPKTAVGSAGEQRYSVHNIQLDDIDLSAEGNVIAIALYQHQSELVDASADKTALTKTPAALNLKMIFHVDDGGNVNLLKEVTQICHQDADENPQCVLLSDQTLIPQYAGVGNNEAVGRRVSSVGYDFEGGELYCGTGFGSAVTCEKIVLGRGSPTNPFLHRYHPDHDNLDARYDAALDEKYASEDDMEKYQEVYEVVRENISLSFSDRYPPDKDEPEWSNPPLEWGDTMLGGTYSETIKGLHKSDIGVSGPFILQKVSSIAVLNE